jgi:hypothetical protein
LRITAFVQDFQREHWHFGGIHAKVQEFLLSTCPKGEIGAENLHFCSNLAVVDLFSGLKDVLMQEFHSYRYTRSGLAMPNWLNRWLSRRLVAEATAGSRTEGRSA